MRRPVFLTESMIAEVSNGDSESGSITSALTPCFSSSAAAFNTHARDTYVHQARDCSPSLEFRTHGHPEDACLRHPTIDHALRAKLLDQARRDPKSSSPAGKLRGFSAPPTRLTRANENHARG